MKENIIYNMDCLEGLKSLPDNCVDCCITSPPYFGLRDYGVAGQIGLEETPEDYVQRLVNVFAEVYRVLKPTGTLWVNIGDSYAGSGKGAWKNKQVWSVSTKPFKDAHFATFPDTLIVDCIKAGSPENGLILDPFMGSGTTAVVARKLSRNYIGFELNPEYVEISNRRIKKELGIFQ